MSNAGLERFSTSEAAANGKRDAESMVEFTRERPPVFLSTAKRFYESRIRSIESRLVSIADRTTAKRGDATDPQSYYTTKDRMADEWKASNRARLDRDIDRVNAEEYDSSVLDHELEQAKSRLASAQDDWRIRREQWEEVEHGLPRLKGNIKWLVIFLFAIAEIVANLDWLNGLLSDVDSPFPVDPKYFIMAVAFVVSLGLMIMGEKSGEDLRQRNYGQMAWKLVALLAAGSTIAYYRDHSLAVKLATDAEGILDKSKVEFDPSRFGVSLAVFLVFSSIAVIVGFYSSYSNPEYQTRKSAFEKAVAEVKSLEARISELLERKQSERLAFPDGQRMRIEALEEDYKRRLTDESTRIERELEESHPFGFYKAFAAAREELEKMQQDFLAVCSAYVGAYNEVGEGSSDLPPEFTQLDVPERMAVDNADPADFRSAAS